jgi:type IV secretion system protein TrbF
LPPETNPYVAARREFLSVFGDLAQGKRNWQLMAFALAALLAFVLAAYVRLSSQARITPYVVEVDRLGQAAAFGPAEALRPTDARVHVYQLALFIRNLRSVSSDPAAQREMLFSAYAYAAGAARGQLDAYFTDPAHDPRLLGRSLTREVQVTSVLRVPAAASRTWKVAWRETDRPLAAGPLRTAAWEAYLTVELHPPTTTEALLRNPVGLFVTDLSWSEVVTGGNR